MDWKWKNGVESPDLGKNLKGHAPVTLEFVYGHQAEPSHERHCQPSMVCQLT